LGKLNQNWAWHLLEKQLGTQSFIVAERCAKKGPCGRGVGEEVLFGWGGWYIFAMCLRVGTWNLKLWCGWKSVWKSLGIRSQGKKGLIGWGGISIFAMILRVGNWNLKLWCNWKGVQKMPCGRGAGDRLVVQLGGLYIFPMFWLWFSCGSSETTFDYEWCELLVLVQQ
jgi:hypothetical protein